MCAERTALPIATAAVSRHGLVQRLARTVAEMWRLWTNRRAFRRLNELSDWELVDIGLTREDIAQAYDGPIMDDPTRRLARIARARAEARMTVRRP